MGLPEQMEHRLIWNRIREKNMLLYETENFYMSKEGITMMLTIMDTREMDKRHLETEIARHIRALEEHGMDHKEAAEFISSVMNIGIALEEKLKNK